MKKSSLYCAISSALLLSSVFNAHAGTVIKQTSSQMCFRTADNAVNGTQVVLNNNCSGDAAGFSWTSGGSIKHVKSGLCVHPGGLANPVDGQQLVLWSGCDFDNRVKFTKTSANAIKHVSGGKCVQPTNTSDGSNLVVKSQCGANQSKFVVEQQINSGANVSNDTVKVQFNIDTKHAVGQFDSFDRRKFITLHSSNTESDWFGNNAQSLNAPNADPNLMTNFLENYDVYFGRDTGSMKYQLTQLPEDSAKPGYVSAVTATTNGGGVKWNYSNITTDEAKAMRKHEGRNSDLIVAAQQHPYYPDGTKIGNQNWSFSQTDTAGEPLGTALGDYMAQFLQKYFKAGASDTLGQKRPTYLEVMNEPLFELHDFPHKGYDKESLYDIFRLHNSVADVVHNNSALNDVKVGGFTVAFPDYEKGANYFDNWKQRDKAFLDIAGDKMDFISMHLYDFPNFPGGPGGQHQEQYRKGSNMEATLDMVEQYMAYKWGSIKPIVISEYGSQLQGSFGTKWTPQRDWLCLKAMSSMLMSFMERPNRIDKAIPFIPLKAEWGRISDTIPYYWRLLRQAKEGEGETGEQWVYTEMVKFYQLWSDIKGTRIDSWASDLDIQADAYVDGKDVYLVLNSLENSPTNIDLSVLGDGSNSVTGVNIKHLHPDAQGKPVLDDNDSTVLPDLVNLGTESTMIIKISHQSNVIINNINQETKHYASAVVKDIVANSTQFFTINNVDKGTNGEAVLRLGVGRPHGKSLTPTVTVNGNKVAVPTDFRGYDQVNGGLGRERFFGVLEIPVPYSDLAKTNSIEVTFPDTGGAVSSLTLQNFKMSKSITR
ncbi:ricin-type beta-trefoil lectin domain protein [Pseudoalteromonas sp. Z9A4]|uniref:ricin-type beta-trefoil lectin domain protein n=1 Tax=Pseudoalteromonas sp. Z9A4 TaxID=2686353 RepID=UPI00140CED06|nr:ricin-type beta-trefoil lectin domain protein [Pseudoalteromonas sp. Z9A4]